jgi:hypothetical protein
MKYPKAVRQLIAPTTQNGSSDDAIQFQIQMAEVSFEIFSFFYAI